MENIPTNESIVKLKKLSGQYMKFVYELHQTLVDQDVMLVYEGEVNQSIMKAFTTLAEKSLDETDESTTIKKRVYHVMVECLQNICKHADDAETGEPDIPGAGIFMVGVNEQAYSVTSGNVVSLEKAEFLKSKLDELNQMNRDELKTMYKKQMRESRLSDKGGAGLGLIDMAKKTGNRLKYNIEYLNDKSAFFILKTKVTKS